jgi:hypothetical protein
MFRRVQVPQTRSQKNTKRFPCTCNTLAHRLIQPLNANPKIGYLEIRANRNFKLQMEGKEAMQPNHAFSTEQIEIRCVSQNRLQSSRSLKLHEQTRNCTNEPKLAAFRKIAICSPKPGVLCELSPHAASSSRSKLHEQTPPPIPPMGFSPLSAFQRSWFIAFSPNCTNKLALRDWDCLVLSPPSSPTHTFRETSPSKLTPHHSAPPPSYGRIDPSCRI